MQHFSVKSAVSEKHSTFQCNLGHMVLKGVKWLHNAKLGQMVLKGVNRVHNDKTGANGLERSQLGTQYKNEVIWY